MNKEARYVIRVANRRGDSPREQPGLLAEVRALVKPLGGYAMNLRVSRPAVEFDLFCGPDVDAKTFYPALEALGPVLSCRRLENLPLTAAPAEVMSEARALFNEERYWEAHEVLEGLWKVVTGSEKQLLQGMILAAAALVHAQKNEPKVVGSMLEDAARRLENQPASYHGIDIARFREDIKKIIFAKTIHFPAI
jgi:hypothetical protein